jgi:hypothetical protein
MMREEDQHQDRGLMLSGHYATLRNYDLGTVRIHLPPGIITGELAPHFTNEATAQNAVKPNPPAKTNNRRKQFEEEEYSRFYEHLLPYEGNITIDFRSKLKCFRVESYFIEDYHHLSSYHHDQCRL